jgi:hypothetical protein
MTTTDRIDAVRVLLGEAEAAHGVYETTELKGVYDQAWPSWYAAYAVDHGIGDLLGHPVVVETLAELFGRTFKDFKESEPRPTEPWAGYTARRIVAEL